LKSSGDKASPCFRPFWIGKLSDKCIPIRTLNEEDLKGKIHSEEPGMEARLISKLSLERCLARYRLD
jgi:hypothetical protein